MTRIEQTPNLHSPEAATPAASATPARKPVHTAFLTIPLIGAALALSMVPVTTPAQAQPVVVENTLDPATGAGELTMQEVVGFSDLDLASPQGRASFDRRIESAIDNVCGDADPRDLHAVVDRRHCRTEASRQAFADRDVILARIEGGQQVAALTIDVAKRH